MSLTEQVEFQTALQGGNRVQVPKLVRWKYKLDSDQVLKKITRFEEVEDLFEFGAFFFSLFNDVLDYKDRDFSMMRYPCC